MILTPFPHPFTQLSTRLQSRNLQRQEVALPVPIPDSCPPLIITPGELLDICPGDLPGRTRARGICPMHSAREGPTGCLPGKEKATGAFSEPVVDLHAGPDDLVRVGAHGVRIGAPVAEDRFELERTERGR
jgi:hypothetical protein